MQTRFATLTAAVVLAAFTPLAHAQTPAAPQTQAPPVPASAFTGQVDFGGLFTTVDGDEARYERYRDTRDGVYSTLRINREGTSYLFDANAYHIGYRDQRYAATLISRKVNATMSWVGIPLNFSYIARTPYVSDGNGLLSLPDSSQSAVQGPSNTTTDGAVGIPCAPGGPPAACGNPAQADQAKANRSIYNGVANQFDLRYDRNVANFGFNYAATQALDVDARYYLSMRDGTQPWGASYAFNTAVELPLPLDQRQNDFSLGTTWATPTKMFRVAWNGSWFNNNIQTLTWDNPIRITDFNNGLVPPNGPYDPSGYSNGNGPAQGREALFPNNQSHVFSGTGMYKLSSKTTLNGTAQFTRQTQDEALIPFTINQVINTPLVFAAFPHIANLPRQSAEAEAIGINTLINLSTKLSRSANLVVRYRYNKRDVKTPIFDATEYVRFDAVPEEIEEGHSVQYDNSRQIFDANMSFHRGPWGSFRIGYGHEGVNREGRGFADVGEHIFRASYDPLSSRYLQVRAQFDAGWRRGEGFVEASAGADDETPATGPGGTQPTLRYYDEADRDRVRGSVLVTVTPTDKVDVFGQFAASQDEYMADDTAQVSRPGEYFGLLESTSTSWNVGVNFHPSDMVGLGASYGFDKYGSFQKSRNANPPPDPTWTDPSRDWTLDNDDNVNTFTIYLDLTKPVRNTDIRFSYDFQDSNNAFVHGGPRIQSLQAAGQFIALPDVDNTWNRLRTDVDYYFSQKIGFGLTYYFEKLDIVDFNTIDEPGPNGFAAQTEVPRIDWLGGLITGYGNRPYNGSTFAVRLIYRF
jgi:MtrB/PioB family decaheme-associated outer membrane protein